MIQSKRYEEIKTTIAQVIEDYCPIGSTTDIFNLAKAMKIKVLYATQIIKNNIDISELDIFKLPNSFLHYYDKLGVLVVYIDDIGCTIERQRFSLAHEIGHIILEHLTQSEANEEEANFVAEYLLVPYSLVMIEEASSYMCNPSFIEYAFNVSSDVAYISASHINNRYNLTYAPFKYEKTINTIFKDYLLYLIEEYNYHVESTI